MGEREAIYRAIESERGRQEMLHRGDSVAHQRQAWGLAVLIEEVGEVAKAMLNHRAMSERPDVLPGLTLATRIELVQVAAVAVALIEACDERFGREHQEAAAVRARAERRQKALESAQRPLLSKPTAESEHVSATARIEGPLDGGAGIAVHVHDDPDPSVKYVIGMDPATP